MTGLPPVVSPATRVLVLGSFPGARSLAAQQYYAHPQNQFWKILQALWPAEPLPLEAERYRLRCEWLLARGLGLWDVVASCRRIGSLDTAIRDAEPNDIAGLRLPRLEAIVHNGSESLRQAGRSTSSLPAGIVSYRVPSTSPANASWSFERKLAAWRDVFARHALV